MACGRTSSEANGWHQPASELLLRGNLLVSIVCCTLVHHIVFCVEDQRGSLVVAQHQLALELCKAICFEFRVSGSYCPHESLFKTGLNSNTSQSSSATNDSHYYYYYALGLFYQVLLFFNGGTRGCAWKCLLLPLSVTKHVLSLTGIVNSQRNLHIHQFPTAPQRGRGLGIGEYALSK